MFGHLMLAEIKNRIGRILNPPETPVEFYSGVEGITWKVNRPFSQFSYEASPWAHEYLVQEAEREGLSLLSISDILLHRNLGERIDDWVLFDSYGVMICPGNHWRILELDKERGVAKLQFCTTFGLEDLENIGPFELPLNIPFFTGVTVSTFIEKASGTTVPFLEARDRFINEVHQDRQVTVKRSETIYFMEGRGPDLGLFTEYIKPQPR